MRPTPVDNNSHTRWTVHAVTVQEITRNSRGEWTVRSEKTETIDKKGRIR